MQEKMEGRGYSQGGGMKKGIIYMKHTPIKGGKEEQMCYIAIGQEQEREKIESIQPDMRARY